MSSSSKGSRSNKGQKGGNKQQHQQQQQQLQKQQNIGEGSIDTETKVDQNHTVNHNEKDVPHKIAPTAEQLRIAQMIDTGNAHSESELVLQEKLQQVGSIYFYDLFSILKTIFFRLCKLLVLALMRHLWHYMIVIMM